ncbi:transcription initiation factor IIB [Botryosphaeria dothidea]
MPSASHLSPLLFFVLDRTHNPTCPRPNAPSPLERRRRSRWREAGILFFCEQLGLRAAPSLSPSRRSKRRRPTRTRSLLDHGEVAPVAPAEPRRALPLSQELTDKQTFAIQLFAPEPAAACNMALSPGEVRPMDNSIKHEDEYVDNFNIHMICPDCKETPPNLVEEFSSGDTVCGSCGLVLSARVVDTRSEWRTFSNDDQNGDDPSRVGDAANPLLNGSQLATNISYTDGAKSRELNRAQNKSGTDKSNKSLMQAYKLIGQWCDRWLLPHTVSDTAKHMYKMTDDSRFFKGKALETIVAGCLFLACRQAQQGRSFRELHELTGVSKKEIGRIFKLLDTFFNKQNKSGTVVTTGGMVMAGDSYKSKEATSPPELCARYCNALGMDNRVQMLAQRLAEEMVKQGALAGRSPLSACAACIYMISYLVDQPLTAKEIAPVAGVSDGTIRTAYKHLYAEKDKLLDPTWVKEKGLKVDKLPAA